MSHPSSRQGGRPTTNKTLIVLTTTKIWSWFPEGLMPRRIDWLTEWMNEWINEWPSVVKWLWQWLWNVKELMSLFYLLRSMFIKNVSCFPVCLSVSVCPPVSVCPSVPPFACLFFSLSGELEPSVLQRRIQKACQCPRYKTPYDWVHKAG